jgi:3-phenylpropionate/cinnamic acid dioxygenase small subunit
MSDAEVSSITATLIAYATAIDTKDWTLFRSLFTADCVFDGGGHRFHGVDPLTDHMRALHEPLDGSRHHLGNFVIEVDGESARATSYLDALLVRRRHPDGPTLRVTGSYEDQLRRESGRWLIQQRTFRFLWSEGNLGLIAEA